MVKRKEDPLGTLSRLRGRGTGSAKLHRLFGHDTASELVPPESPSRFEYHLLLRLQESLELESLLEIFFRQIAEPFGLCELRYVAPEGDGSCRFGTGARSRLSFGLQRGSESLGVLHLGSARPVDHARVPVLTRCVALLQVPLRNARLYDEAVKRSRRDALTGLPNRAALEAALTEEVSLAQREAAPLGLLIADVDCFKTVNDGNGHLFGDAALIRVADQLKRCSRRNDLLFRYAGDEFVMLARFTTPNGLKELAGRMLRSCRRQCYQGNGKPLRITISIGAAMLREGEGGGELLQRADEAMYAAKLQGRDRTVVLE